MTQKNTSILPFEEYVLEHWVFVFCVAGSEDSNPGSPYCAPCFYAYDPSRKMLVFSSDPSTQHMRLAIQSGLVAGSVFSETKKLDEIKGIQFTGRLVVFNPDEHSWAEHLYLQTFPFAELNGTPLWGVKLKWVKFTDNSKGFGHKEIWSPGKEPDATE